jgi:hypothetical protein
VVGFKSMYQGCLKEQFLLCVKIDYGNVIRITERTFFPSLPFIPLLILSSQDFDLWIHQPSTFNSCILMCQYKCGETKTMLGVSGRKN